MFGQSFIEFIHAHFDTVAPKTSATLEKLAATHSHSSGTCIFLRSANATTYTSQTSHPLIQKASEMPFRANSYPRHSAEP